MYDDMWALAGFFLPEMHGLYSDSRGLHSKDKSRIGMINNKINTRLIFPFRLCSAAYSTKRSEDSDIIKPKNVCVSDAMVYETTPLFLCLLILLSLFIDDVLTKKLWRCLA